MLGIVRSLNEVIYESSVLGYHYLSWQLAASMRWQHGQLADRHGCGDVPPVEVLQSSSAFSFYLSPQGLNLILRYSDYTCAY